MIKINKKCSNCGCEEFIYLETKPKSYLWLNILTAISLSILVIVAFLITNTYNIFDFLQVKNIHDAILNLIITLFVFIPINAALIITQVILRTQPKRIRRICTNCEKAIYIDEYNEITNTHVKATKQD